MCLWPAFLAHPVYYDRPYTFTIQPLFKISPFYYLSVSAAKAIETDLKTENPVTIVVNKPADIPHVSQVIVSFVWRKIYRLLILILLHVVSKIVARVYEWQIF